MNEEPVQAQAPGAPAVAAPQPARPRIALVNIAKVMREFGRAKYEGEQINKKRQEFIDAAMKYRSAGAEVARKAQTTQVPEEKAKFEKEAIEYQRKLQDLEKDGQKALNEITDRIVVEMYQNIKMVINDIAVTNNLDLVMCYPDSSTPEEDRKPVVAQMKLQAPALFPMYHRNMDITEVVIATLNRRHPPPATPIATPGQVPPTGLAPAPTPGITPTGGRP
jgi:Skp family chaperone for outer membrane proteins